MLWGPAAGQQRSSELFSKATAMREDTSHHAANSTPAVRQIPPRRRVRSIHTLQNPGRAKELERPHGHNPTSTDALAEAITNFCQQRIRTVDQGTNAIGPTMPAAAAPDQGHAGARRHSEIAAAGHAVTAAATAALGSQHGVWTERHGHDRSTPRPFSSRETKSSSTAEATMEARRITTTALGYQQGG
jgi:hypothetical protein